MRIKTNSPVKRSQFTVVENLILRDPDISASARGLFVTLLSLPPTWDFSSTGLSKIFKSYGVTHIRADLNALIKAGYVTRTRVHEGGRFLGMQYALHEIPVGHVENRSEVTEQVESGSLRQDLVEQELDNQGPDIQHLVPQHLVKNIQLNTYRFNLNLIKDLKEEEREETPAAEELYSPEMGQGALAVYRKYFPDYHPNCTQQDLIITDVSNLEVWGQCCRSWAGNGYRPGSIDKLVDFYRQRLNARGTPGNKRLSPHQVISQSDECPVCSAQPPRPCPIHPKEAR